MSVRQTSGGRRLRIDTHEREASVHYTLHGHIDESCDIESLADTAGVACVMHLGDIEFINSIGVRKWLLMMRRFEERQVHVRIMECPSVIVQQLNAIAGFAGGAEIGSFFAPYECSDCGYEGDVLVAVAEHFDVLSRLAAPQMKCPDCGKLMQLAAPEDRYLAFMEPEDAAIQ
jgi:predicted RNA-binding Zn-ribbon protein involved in translation (DUF1610 family)